MNVLTRADILKCADLPRVRLEIPEWGGDVFVRSMTALEKDRYDAEVIAARNDADRLSGWRVRTALRCTVDDTGTRLFSDEDIESLGGKSSAPIMRIFDKVQELSKVSEDSASAEKN